MDSPQWNGEPGALPYDRDRFRAEDDRDDRERCPWCEALTTEPHFPQCALYLPMCPTCTRPTRREGQPCGRCVACREASA